MARVVLVLNDTFVLDDTAQVLRKVVPSCAHDALQHLSMIECEESATASAQQVALGSVVKIVNVSLLHHVGVEHSVLEHHVLIVVFYGI